MAVQFDRKVVVTVGEREGERILIRNLRMQFRVEKTDQPDPNTASITIFNLSPFSRSKLEENTDLFLTIEAGYGDETKIIFSGDVETIKSTKSQLDWATIIETGDGGKDISETFLDKSYKKGTKVTTIIQDALNVFPTLKNKLLDGNLVDSAKELVTGGTFSGKAKDILSSLLGSQDLDFSVQDGEIVITEEYQPTNNEVYVVSSSSGLINSPAKTEKKTKDGKIRKGATFTALLNPNFKPKQLVKVVSVELEGEYVINKVTHQGDSQSGTFYSIVEALER